MNRILLIDDDPTLVHLLSEFLADDDFEVIGALSGSAGLHLAYEQHPDLILLDVMLPGMDGWEVCARLREMSDVPIIMLTAKTSETDKLRGFRLGVDDYVTKPFSFKELVARIQALLARVKSTDSKTGYLIHGRVSLDTEKYQAYFEEKTLELTPTEYRLLEALVKRKGKVASEEELVQAVWGKNRSEDTALVRRYILMLRKKLETDPSTPEHILTVRGFGYRLGTGPLPSLEE
ncbi:MAG: response regulator transcription factor [Anaerolineales bacterium]|uniref:Response regulator transcription factor n=1 Tax=Candidatus Desulfolinea nitratireducens TaxID=2841698 RepID=A0A8J6NKE2_9CHLR|nr:response regulator transcription factor [Candidatus Desulfolinea nitratireducens]MBL6960841.1 response regulator transcription factor [Anaerolineales bacterium]